MYHDYRHPKPRAPNKISFRKNTRARRHVIIGLSSARNIIAVSSWLISERDIIKINFASVYDLSILISGL